MLLTIYNHKYQMVKGTCRIITQGAPCVMHPDMSVFEFRTLVPNTDTPVIY